MAGNGLKGSDVARGSGEDLLKILILRGPKIGATSLDRLSDGFSCIDKRGVVGIGLSSNYGIAAELFHSALLAGLPLHIYEEFKDFFTMDLLL